MNSENISLSLPFYAVTEEFCPRVGVSKQKWFLLVALRSTKSVKTLRMKVQVVYYLFPPVKTCFLLHRKETRASFFQEGKKKSRLELSLKLASPFHSFGLTKFFLEAILTILHSLSSAMSRRQQNKVIVDIDHGYVKGGHFVDTE